MRGFFLRPALLVGLASRRSARLAHGERARAPFASPLSSLDVAAFLLQFPDLGAHVRVQAGHAPS